MQIRLARIEKKYEADCLSIFNEIVDEGLSFPMDTPFTYEDFRKKFPPHEIVWCAVDENERVMGFFHIHPNNVGRCSHIANCGFGVAIESRGKGIGRMLVAKSIEVAREEGYHGMQFNTVVSTNEAAIALYQSFGFEIIATIPGGFRQGSLETPRFVDMYIMYLKL